MAVLPAPVAEAATDLVTNCSGSPSVSGALPYEVAHASPGDTVGFSLSPPCATITLTTDINISEDLTVTGPGANTLAVTSSGDVSAFDVDSGVTASLSGLTVENVDNTTGLGGGIYNDGTLTISDSTISGNTDSDGYGGGIMNDDDGTLTVTDSTVSGNTAVDGYGGGILNDGTLTVTNSTLAGNTATGVGGAIDNQGTATVTSSTLWHNEAEYGGNLNNLGPLNIGSTIVADPVTGTDCHEAAAITDLGDNLADDGSCDFTAGTDLSDTPSHLDTSGLEANGGPTETIALDSGSAAIDHVSNGTLCPSTDQRGAPRTVPCDIGAYDTDWGPPVSVDVSGTQGFGGTPSLTYTTSAPPGVVSGTLACTTVDNGTPISAGLPVGDYTVDGSSCSGLSSSDPAAYAVFPQSYAGVTDGFDVSAPSNWSVDTSPSPESNENQIYDLTCTSSTFCVAVGFAYDGSTDQALIETWNGSTWTVASNPQPSTTYDVLASVSCTSASDCQAVGEYQNGTPYDNLVESWNGTAWSVVPSPSPGSQENELDSVSCTSATACEAVGDYDVGTTGETLAESWNGTTWSVASTPDPGTATNALDGVSCTSATDCQAVGVYANQPNNSDFKTLVESWNGTAWSFVSSPDQGSSANDLYGVSCTSATSCQAVGFTAHATLVESWNGTAWSIVSSPDQGTDPFLSSVSCPTATSCTAVGSDLSGTSLQTLIESWNGTTWTVVPSPDTGTGDNVLYGVTCLTPSDCHAGGYDVNGSTEDTLIESSSPPPPVVSEVSPDTGFTSGTNTVTITGSGFAGATAVDVGANPATIDTVTGDTSITITVPPGSAGPPVDITVTAPGGLSTSTPADEYTYTVDQGPNTQPCQPTCTNTESTTLNDTTVSATGNSGTSNPGPSTTLVVNTDTLSCGASKSHDYDYPTAVSTLTATDFPTGAALTVTETVADEPTTAGVKVCYAPGSDTTGTFLRHCHPSMHAPCLESLVESSGSVVATFLTPPTDPRFWTGEAATDLKKFAPLTGAAGSTVTITGKNLAGVIAVVIGGAQAPISPASTDTKLEVTVPQGARTGLITVTSASGEAVSAKPFTVKSS
jgi:hypothetical protein